MYISGSYNLQSISVVSDGLFICGDISMPSTDEATTIIVVDGQEAEVVGSNSGDFIIVDVVVGNNTGEAIVIMPASLQLIIYPNPFN